MITKYFFNETIGNGYYVNVGDFAWFLALLIPSIILDLIFSPIEILAFIWYKIYTRR